ncbi:hypothetical protein P88_00170 [Erwinia phage phiEt88]|uniref:tail assembly chaperone n=1 Tax=Erwinia phage phiEt88 TaxID=925984 RepID=UPI0001F1FC61|nr:tail assembly chaperone [Erwinia phage phiEt88]CBX44528.1 hypothetical protein P88_00170 [Erwinia phage phiEt88]
MQPEFHEFQIGEKTFQAVKMNAFAAAKHLTRLKVLLDKGLAQGTNASAVQLLAGIDENTLENVILPMLKDAAVTSITDGKKIDSPAGLNSVFSADTLFDFYELTWEVLKLNFSPFFSKVLSLFGLSPEELAGRVKNLAKVQSQAN